LDVTYDFLAFLQPIAELNSRELVIKDSYEDMQIDRLIRRDKFFHSSGTYNDCGFVTFKVDEKCRCSWPSAMGTFEFSYAVYYPQMERRHYVYLSATVFRQKCRRHGRLAKPLM